jgi:hypothetical protein
MYIVEIWHVIWYDLIRRTLFHYSSTISLELYTACGTTSIVEVNSFEKIYL